jgi:hypothetical protein
MSLTDRILEALRAAILLEARVSALAENVGGLARDVRDIDKRLVRVEALIEFGSRGGFSSSSSSAPPAIESRSE